ncbi:hypothetical protein QJS10_CPA07g00681 [Acorus calamus]|uniref:DUF4283 domain-containing protein n=1 Tax=Acorus calamus TaxID=4465 RepID=A0AAV9EK91_ACOCL|nr:hypothetical protein QJS10_CPA07g00681 [Acorus calamus]
MSPHLHSRLVRRWTLIRSGGLISLKEWTPEYGATPSETFRWCMTLYGLPLHWRSVDCLWQLISRLGKITEIEWKGINKSEVAFIEFTLVAGVKRNWPKTMLVGYGREAYCIRIEATLMPMVSK